MTNKGEKFFEQKMDRREFLKKAGIGGAGIALGLSGASAFFAPKLDGQEKISYGDEKISFYGNTKLALPLLCRRISILLFWICIRLTKRKSSNYLKTGRIIVPNL